MYIIDRCPCCASAELDRWPAIVSPFVATYACHTRPGPAHLCQCRGCSFRFFDTRLTGEEVARLYGGYRGEQYFRARHRCEFWYTRSINDHIGGDPAKIASRRDGLAHRLGARADGITTVLDYGGDRGQFIPEELGRERFVYEISDVPTVDGVTHLQSVEGRHFDFVMLAHVLEHCSDPRDFLRGIRALGHRDTLFYFEVPYERPTLTFAGRGAAQQHYLNALLHLGPAIQLVDLYSTLFRVRFDVIPPLGLQKCSEHLNFFNPSSLKALLESEGMCLEECSVAPFDFAERSPRKVLNRILYGFARLA